MDFSNLKAFLDYLVTWRIPGVDCIVIKDGETVFRHSAGFADIEKGEKMKGDETYNMWSSSKPITCAAALTLYEKGKFILSDPIDQYLPEFSDMKVKIIDECGRSSLVPAKNKISVRDLFSMTAGFEYTMDGEIIESVKRDTNGLCPTREVVRAMAGLPLIFEPGSHWNYSVCHEILAGLVEVISGERFSDYVKRVIFDPLEMRDSTFAYPEDRLTARMARQYQYNLEKEIAVPTNNSVSHRLGKDYESGGAGMIGTLADYAKFCYALSNGGVGLNGAKILSRRTIDLMRTNVLTEEQMKDVNWPQLVGYGYGLGVRTMVSVADGGSNGPVGEFGWAGAAGTYALIDPDNRLTLVYGQHLLENQEDFISPRLRNILYSSI